MSSTTVETHAILDSLEYDDGILLWAGRKVTEIAEDVGSTPFYAYDGQRIAERVAELRTAMPRSLKFHYAIKANPMPAVVRHLAGLVDGLDVASAGELETALDTGTDPEEISFAGPGKRDSELEAAIRAGITINLESESELRRVIAAENRLQIKARVAVRVNPSFELKTAGMKMGGRPSQFGIDAETVPAVLEKIESAGLEFRGFHVFSGSQNLLHSAIVDALDQTVELVLELANSTKLKCPTVNLGGGLGIPYFPKEEPLDLSLLAAPYEKAVDTLSRELDTPEVIMELGRFLVGEAGIYVCSVIDMKQSRGTQFAVCDGGLHHNLAVTGNFGQILRKNYPVVSVEGNSGPFEKVTVVGPLCTPLDLLADGMTMGRLREGSLVAVLQSGAYGASASPDRFLSHPPCEEILL